MALTLWGGTIVCIMVAYFMVILQYQLFADGYAIGSMSVWFDTLVGEKLYWQPYDSVRGLNRQVLLTLRHPDSSYHDRIFTYAVANPLALRHGSSLDLAKFEFASNIDTSSECFATMEYGLVRLQT